MGTTYISYPGLSEELVIDKNYKCSQFYELVPGCGVFCRMPQSLQIRFFQSIRNCKLPITGIIFRTNPSFLQNIKRILPYATDNSQIFCYENEADNNDYGLRVNKGILSESKATQFRELINNYPNHLLLVSNPYSGPDFMQFITNKDTLMNRASLLYFENKKIFTHRFKKEINFIDEFGLNDFAKLTEFFDKANPEEIYFFKPSGESAGGTSVIPLNREAFIANNALIKKYLKADIYSVFKKLETINIRSPKGEHHGTQFRAFITNDGEFIGFIVKFSSNAITQQHKRTSLKNLNQLYNSSSGTAISILFECGKTIKPLTLSLSKHETIFDESTIQDYLKTLTFGNLSLTNQNDLSYIMNILCPKAEEIRNYYNEFFFKQEWNSLYRKFILDKTYFD